MRFKPVPEPRGLDFLADARGALPLVPAAEADAVARLTARTPLSDDGVAREALTFLRALGLAERVDSGFVRGDRSVEADTLREPFRERVFGAREVLAALDDGPKTEAEAFESLAAQLSRWERDRHENWERKWRERTANLLGWAVEFGLVERDGEDYRRA